MYQINKITSNRVIDFAAEELAKYLRMMMPYCGDIDVVYAPSATDGFRLGLMQDLGLDVSDADDTELDDILYINTDEEGGIIAGDNGRSVLLAVYEYLRQNGCRWLMPGIDGEYIPRRDITPVSYRFKPSCRYRGQATEGVISYEMSKDVLDFMPKLGLNLFMNEGRNPVGWYNGYYNHVYNEENRPPEPISEEQGLQWKRSFESEMKKRGIQFHDVGHCWTYDPFGLLFGEFDKSNTADDSHLVPPGQRQYLAMVNGKRRIYQGLPVNTNICMSNPEAREKIVRYAADYAAKNPSDYLHIWLSDSKNQQCECEACQKKTPSDWYVVMMNELDELLTKEGLDNRIVFIAYLDTTWGAEVETIKNPSRFTLLFAPITRSYTETLPKERTYPTSPKYDRNKMVLPKNLEENLACFQSWRESWKGGTLFFEYHFWRHQCFDLGGIELAKRLNEDVRVYLENGINGGMQDGSQRSFFPTGFAFYVYSRTLFDVSLTVEELAEEYFSVAFGEDWRSFYDYLERLGAAFSMKYLEGEIYFDPENSPYYNPDHLASLARAKDILEEGRALISSHYNSAQRVQTASVRILEKHVIYSELLLDALMSKAAGDDDAALEKYKSLIKRFGREEVFVDRFYDHRNFSYAYEKLFKTRAKVTEPITQ
ncbi:MAG: DUF4838 domain-containing protein [Ruminococcaceae bacterium]|nr:DUF4838 domain-containing protein [Oscillospiraceae bacterium]